MEGQIQEQTGLRVPQRVLLDQRHRLGRVHIARVRRAVEAVGRAIVLPQVDHPVPDPLGPVVLAATEESQVMVEPAIHRQGRRGARADVPFSHHVRAIARGAQLLGQHLHPQVHAAAVAHAAVELVHVEREAAREERRPRGRTVLERVCVLAAGMRWRTIGWVRAIGWAEGSGAQRRTGTAACLSVIAAAILGRRLTHRNFRAASPLSSRDPSGRPPSSARGFSTAR